MLGKIIISLDEMPTLKSAIELIEKVGSSVYAVKIHNFYDQHGPEVFSLLKRAGVGNVWIDHKLYDIPNTVKLRADAIVADIITVHATGGVKMMKEAVSSGKEIFAVSVLTSFTAEEVRKIYNREVNDVVMILAELAEEAGVAGVVCSPQEVKMLRIRLPKMKLVVPGIRSVGQDLNDQNRVGTPAEAVFNGATHLVIGRQITKAPDPIEALEMIKREINNVCSN